MSIKRANFNVDAWKFAIFLPMGQMYYTQKIMMFSPLVFELRNFLLADAPFFCVTMYIFERLSKEEFLT